MDLIKLKKGLDLPISGAPEQEVTNSPSVRSVAVVGYDYNGLKPKMMVEVDAKVKRGTPLFHNKENPEAMIVSPVKGRVVAINRGARRVLESVVVEIDDAKDKGISFAKIGNARSADGIAKKLCAAGLWTSFRTRPYSKVPHHEDRPLGIYVTATDTEPLAADPAKVIAGFEEDLEKGLSIISKLTEGPTFFCKSPDLDFDPSSVKDVVPIGFSGPHPAGLAGTHIHFLLRPEAEKPVWTISYRDVIKIGALFRTGYIDPTTIISLCGPVAKNPRLIKTISGASIDDLIKREVPSGLPIRSLSGSVLSGRKAEGPTAYLGRYHGQVSLIEEDHKQIPLGWIRPMYSKFAFQPVLGSAFALKLYNLTSNLNGGRRAMVPIGTFEELMPQDYLPTQLLRALLVKDTDVAQSLGALELDEEDLGLVGFACPAKYEYGLALRECLEKIEKEG